MALQHNPKIVTNGLVLCLDAGNPLSYSGSGTTWNDLSGNGNNGTLTNGPTFSSSNAGSIVFDGTNDYTSISSSGYNLGVNFTIQTWIKPIKFGGGPSWNRSSIITNSYPYSTDKGFWMCTSSQHPSTLAATSGLEHFLISIGADQYYATCTRGSLTPYVNKWVNLSAVINSTSLIKLYVNGIEPSYLAQTNGPASLSYDSGPFAIGSRNNSSEYCGDYIANMLIFNRSLSASEVLQNYNATKGRYGL